MVKDKRILPDVFQLIFLKEDGTADVFDDLPQHRSLETMKDSEYERDQIMWKRGLNKALENLAFFNSSSETWLDRCNNKYMMQ